MVYICSAKELEFLQKACELTENNVPWDSSTCEPIWQFQRSGFAFLNKEGEAGDGNIIGYPELVNRILVPIELIQIFRDVTNEDDFDKISDLNNRLALHYETLSEKHNDYDIEYFVSIWNQQNKEKIDYAKAEDFLLTQTYFVFDYGIQDGKVYMVT